MKPKAFAGVLVLLSALVALFAPPASDGATLATIEIDFFNYYSEQAGLGTIQFGLTNFQFGQFYDVTELTDLRVRAYVIYRAPQGTLLGSGQHASGEIAIFKNGSAYEARFGQEPFCFEPYPEDYGITLESSSTSAGTYHIGGVSALYSTSVWFDDPMPSAAPLPPALFMLAPGLAGIVALRIKSSR